MLARLAALALVAAPLAAQIAEVPPAVASSYAVAADVPDGFYLEDAADARFSQPVAVAFAPGGRTFVVEKRGVVWVVQNGVRQAEPFLDIQAEVLNQHDRGLLGIAVDPAFAENRRVYLSYTVDHEDTGDRERFDAFARVTRYAGRADNPNVADPGSRRVLIGETFATGIASCYKSHTIGTLAFGSDGTLFVGAGDGANYTRIDAGGQYDACFGAGRLDPSEDVGAFRSQRLESLAGKLLRVDPETGLGLPSNPFWTGDPADAASKVWALGLRNPFRFAVDVSGGSASAADGRPGLVYVADVGWNVYEDLHVARGGENFGWPCFEGPDPHAGYQNASPATNGCDTALAGVLVTPSSYWHHSQASRSRPSGRTARALVGGAVYGGTKYPSFYRGALFYGDYSRGWSAAAQLDGSGEPVQERLFSGDFGPVVGYAYDPASQYLHVVNVATGAVQRVRHTDEAANAAPVAQASATPAQGGAGLRVQFSPAGSFDPDGDALSYVWTFGDGAQADGRAPVHAYDAPGVYAARLAVSDGVLVSTATVTVTVRAGGRPAVRVVAPTAAVRARAGETVTLRATVSDPDQSAGSLFVRWTVTQVHDEHVHLDIFQGSDPQTSFRVPEHGLPGEQVYYRVRAEVRDATGLTASDEVALFLDGDVGEVDVTAEGAVLASVLAPLAGRGSTDPEVVRDGVTPTAGADRPDRQFATFTGARDRDTDWVGLSTPGTHRFSSVVFQEGLHQADGGWFETTPRVQVRRDGTWRDATNVTVSPEYRADDGRGFDTYRFQFAPAPGDAVRLVGPPGGSAGYVSVGELRALVVTGEGGGGGDLPAPWASTDVGGPAGAGSAGLVGDAFAVTGGGDVWNQADRFHFAHQPLAGNGSLVARIDALTPGAEWFKAGLMLRASLDPGAPHASVLVSNIGTHVQARTAADSASTAHGDDWGRTAPTWLRLDRAGPLVVARVSDDGVTWRDLGTVAVPALAGPVLAGLAVSSADFGAGATATALFRDVSLTGGLPEGWYAADVGTPAASGEARLDGDAFVLTGGGDIWSRRDAFHFASHVLEADGAVVARATVPDGPHEWSKAGLMVRASAAPGAAHAWFGFSRIGTHLQYRPNAGDSSAGPVDDWAAPEGGWLRLERSGTAVAAFRSADGATWAPFGAVTVPGLGDGPVLVGLAVSAADFGDGVTATARFASVDVVEAAPAAPPLQMASQRVAAVGFGLDAVYPNPAADRAAALVTVPRDTRVEATVVDMLGREVRQETVAMAAGVRDLALDLRGVPAGLYVLRIRDVESYEVRSAPLTVVR